MAKRVFCLSQVQELAYRRDVVISVLLACSRKRPTSSVVENEHGVPDFGARRAVYCLVRGDICDLRKRDLGRLGRPEIIFRWNVACPASLLRVSVVEPDFNTRRFGALSVTGISVTLQPGDKYCLESLHLS
jgi:hypothetical protein